MSGVVESLLRWLKRHDELPLIDVPSAAVDDDTTSAWSDELYLRGLLDDLVRTCVESELSVRPLSVTHSAALAAVLEEVRNDAAWTIEVTA